MFSFFRGDSAPAEEEAPRRSRRNRGGDDEASEVRVIFSLLTIVMTDDCIPTG